MDPLTTADVSENVSKEYFQLTSILKLFTKQRTAAQIESGSVHSTKTTASFSYRLLSTWVIPSLEMRRKGCVKSILAQNIILTLIEEDMLRKLCPWKFFSRVHFPR